MVEQIAFIDTKYQPHKSGQDQTNNAGINVSGVESKVIQATTIEIGSFWISFLAVKFEAACCIAYEITKITPKLTIIKPGLIIISAPVRPSKTAIHRFNFEGSPMNIIAPPAVNKGVIKARAMTVANGVTVIAVYRHNRAVVCITPRKICNLILKIVLFEFEVLLKRVENLEKKINQQKSKKKTRWVKKS